MASTPPPPGSDSGNSTTVPRRRRVLVVDDDATVARTVRRVLCHQRAHLDVSTAESGEQALQIAEEQFVDVVLIDLQMPGMNGVELATFLRRRHPNVVRVAHTGSPDLLAQTNDSSLFHLVLLKPASTQQIVLALDAALGRVPDSPEAASGTGNDLSGVG